MLTKVLRKKVFVKPEVFLLASRRGPFPGEEVSRIPLFPAVPFRATIHELPFKGMV
jgi:hypothetical protein